MEYRIRKNLLGRREVEFKCSACGEKVLCLLADAGTQQPCPACFTPHTCPGEKEKAAADEVAHRLREVARHEHEAAQAEKAKAARAKIGAEAARKLKANMTSQDALENDQSVIRIADWTDRVMWRAFRFLRWLFAVQVLIGYVVLLLGMAIVGVSAIIYLVQASSRNPKYELVSTIFGAGLALTGAGYTLYVTAAIFATIVYIERNTRGILKS